MIIDVRKNVSALDVAKKESKEVQKKFLNIARTMAKWIDLYHSKEKRSTE